MSNDPVFSDWVNQLTVELEKILPGPKTGTPAVMDAKVYYNLGASPYDAARAMMGFYAKLRFQAHAAYFGSKPGEQLPSKATKVTTDVAATERILSLFGEDYSLELTGNEITDRLGVTDPEERKRMKRTIRCMERRRQLKCRRLPNGYMVWRLTRAGR